jgi:hypothetical protein
MVWIDLIAALNGGLQNETIGEAPLHTLEPKALVFGIGVGLDDAAQRIRADPRPFELMVSFEPEQNSLAALAQDVVQEHLCAVFTRAPLAEVSVDKVEDLHVHHCGYRYASRRSEVQRDEVEPSLQHR